MLREVGLTNSDMSYYYDLRIFEWFSGRCRRRHVDEGMSRVDSRNSFEALMCLDRSHIQDEALRNAPWYHPGLPREITLEILHQEEVGSFIVRDSTSHPGCYALSVRVPKYENSSGISHYLVLRTHRGVKLKGLDKEWSTLSALVTHHTLMRELLPCTLRLPKGKGEDKACSAQQNRGGGGTSNADDNNADSDKCGQS